MIEGRSRGGLEISHLLFADETIVFCEGNSVQLGWMQCAFLYFEAVLGPRVILSKSELVLVGNVIDVSNLALILDCNHSYDLSGVAFWVLLLRPEWFGMLLLRR